ncbi:MAG: hypothetical protein IPM98_16870 [Lewinellaceae bacterium]|nr:hypothetical protein [Lewinellaceae bacterium]
MENTRLLQLLRTFSDAELRALKKFVRSPYFNQRREVIDLLDFLEKPLKSKRPAPEKERAFAAIFGKDQFDDHRIRMAMSFLFQLASQFLSVQDFVGDTSQLRLRQAGLLRQRKLQDHARQTLMESATALLSRPQRNADFHQQHYQFLLEKYRAEAEINPTGPLPLQELSNQLDRAFLSRKLWQSCFMLSHQTVYNTTYDFGLLDAALAHLESAPVLDDPSVAVYYFCYRALTNPDETAYFQQFKQLLLQHSQLFPSDEMRDLYVLAINFCIRRYNAGNPDYLPEQFDFYRDGLAQKYFLVDGALSRYTYLNAATIGLVMHELDWVEQFINDYRNFVKEPHRESLYSFNLARLEYQRRHLDKALKLLQKAEYKDLLLHLAAKTLQLKIFYELEEFDLLESHLQTLQTFIRRKKDLGYHRENYLNTIRFTRKLLEANLFDKTVRKALLEEIEGTKGVAEQEWLLERVSGLVG